MFAVLCIDIHLVADLDSASANHTAVVERNYAHVLATTHLPQLEEDIVVDEAERVEEFGHAAGERFVLRMATLARGSAHFKHCTRLRSRH